MEGSDNDYEFRPKQQRFGTREHAGRPTLSSLIEEMKEDNLRDKHWPERDPAQRRAVIYISSSREKLSHFVKSSKTDLYCEAKGYKVVEVIDVVGQSVAAPEERIRELVESGKVDVLVVYSGVRAPLAELMAEHNVGIEPCADWDLFAYAAEQFQAAYENGEIDPGGIGP